MRNDDREDLSGETEDIQEAPADHDSPLQSELSGNKNPVECFVNNKQIFQTLLWTGLCSCQHVITSDLFRAPGYGDCGGVLTPPGDLRSR